MLDSTSIRIAKDDRSIFEEVLTSLESHRPAKSEKDILDKLRSQFGLTANPVEWPDLLINNGCSVEEFLDFVLEQLTPFVLMILELYAFFSRTVSTTGGRTSHFEIQSEALSEVLKFPNIDFPKKVSWVQSWAEVQIESVVIDWDKIGGALGIDNGIFYGNVRDKRLIQSLILARRSGQLSAELRTLGDRLYAIVRRSVNAWHSRHRADRLALGLSEPARWVERLYVPSLNRFLVQEGLSDTRSSEVGVDLANILAPGDHSYTLKEAFCDPALKETAPQLAEEREQRRDWNLQAALFFTALWGLDEPSFRTVAGLLTAHESRTDLLRDSELDSLGPELAAELVENLQTAIVPTGDSNTAIQKVKKKLEILLLPYWKDRWFLYEVWTLCLPMIEVLSLKGSVELLGIRPIADPDIEGTTWNLPTQKAHAPVAKISGVPSAGSLLIWFQRETRSTAEPRNIEPDVRITSPAAPYRDVLILECKDRTKFGVSRASRVAKTYLDGTAAESVWVVNYEEFSKKDSMRAELTQVGNREIGIAYSVRPNSGDRLVRYNIVKLLGSKLGLSPQTQSGEYYLVIDVSGSMIGKLIPNSAKFRQTSPKFSKAYLWCQSVEPIPLDEVASGNLPPRLTGQSAENGAALAEFAASLPREAKLIVVTDFGGKSALVPYLRGGNSQSSPTYLEGHQVEFVIE